MRRVHSNRGDAAPPADIERFSFWDGQTLRANDLNRAGEVADARRWWHNRAVHNAYGIAFGLEFDEVRPNQKKRAKPTGLRLSHGVAYDAFGRMLHVPVDRDVPFPSNVPDSVESCLLVVRFRAPESGACGCSPAPRCCGSERAGDETFELEWIEESRVRWRENVPLARVVFTKSPRRAGIDRTFAAPRLRAARRPHIVADATVPGATQWLGGPASLVRPVPDDQSVVWSPIDVVVDTSAAGFSETPVYIADLAGSLVNLARPQLLRALSPHVVDETPRRFTFRFWILLAQPFFEIEGPVRAATGSETTFTFDGFRNFARQQRLHVSWIGCERDPQPAAPEVRTRARRLCGCAPHAMPLSI